MAVRVLIAGGGTGGHIIPALAIAGALKAGPGGAELLFLGTPRGMESRLVPEAGYWLELIEVGQLKNVSLATRLRTMTDLPRSLLKARALLRSFRPQVVVGVGGYASGPAMAAALLGGVPTLAFEPNAAPGLANRLVGRWVSAAAVNFAPAARYFRRAEVTGIPVREEFFRLQPPEAGSPPHLLVFGGSQGARVLNEAMPKVVAQLLAEVPGLSVLHQAGARQLEGTLAAYRATAADPSRWQVKPFLDDMPGRFEAAALILARSGASTVAELCAAGKPAVLVPFAQAADDHQRKNAEVMAGGAAAVLLPEAELKSPLGSESLLRVLIGLLGDAGELRAMGERARGLAHPDAADRIARRVRLLAGEQ